MKLLRTIANHILVLTMACSVPALSMDKKSDYNYRLSENISQGLDTVGKNLKTIGFNVAAGVGSGIVNATNALVPASEIFKSSLENPKTALALGVAGGYIAYSLRVASMQARQVKEVHQYINPTKAVNTGSNQIRIVVQDTYVNMVQELLAKIPAYQEYAKLWQREGIPHSVKLEIITAINQEKKLLDECITLLSNYLHRATLLPRMVYKGPILVKVAEQNLVKAHKIPQVATYEQLTQDQMNLLEQEVKRLNSYTQARTDTVQNTNDLNDEDEESLEDYNTVDKLKYYFVKGCTVIAQRLQQIPGALYRGASSVAHAATKYATSLVYSKEQSAQWDYWLACKQKAALARLEQELSRVKIQIPN